MWTAICYNSMLYNCITFVTLYANKKLLWSFRDAFSLDWLAQDGVR